MKKHAGNSRKIALSYYLLWGIPSQIDMTFVFIFYFSFQYVVRWYKWENHTNFQIFLKIILASVTKNDNEWKKLSSSIFEILTTNSMFKNKIF